MSTKSRDYVRNKGASERLAERIENMWHAKGYTQVKVWVETTQNVSQHGTRLPPIHSIRSNIKFNVASIEKGLIE